MFYKLKISFLVYVILALIGISCQKESENLSVIDEQECLVEIDGEFILVELDELPEYKFGGEDGFYAGIFEILKYPFEARENGIEGLCTLKYEISKSGEIENIIIDSDPGAGIGEVSVEALESIANGEVI